MFWVAQAQVFFVWLMAPHRPIMCLPGTMPNPVDHEPICVPSVSGLLGQTRERLLPYRDGIAAHHTGVFRAIGKGSPTGTLILEITN